MKPTLYLHIGPMKTGSTAIQRWLSRAGDELAKAGVFIPRALTINASRLAVLALARRDGAPIAEFDSKRLTALFDELTSAPPGARVAVISGEMLGQKLRTVDAVASLREMLAPYFSEFRIITYLRRQDQLSLSHYSTSLRLGERRARPLNKLFDYDQMLSSWSEVFGSEAMVVRIFDRSRMRNENVVEDFAASLELPTPTVQEGGKDENPSLVPEAQAFLARLSHSVRESGYDRPFMGIRDHEQIIKHLNETFAGRGYLPARDEVLAFYAPIRASNERVRQRWFSDQESLFSEDFSIYPSDESRKAPPAKVLEVAMSVLTLLQTQPKEYLDLAALPADDLGDDKVLRIRLEKRAARRRRSARGALPPP